MSSQRWQWILTLISPRTTGTRAASFMSFLGGFSPFFSASRSASEYSTAAVSVSRSMAAVIMRVMGGCFFMSP